MVIITPHLTDYTYTKYHDDIRVQIIDTLSENSIDQNVRNHLEAMHFHELTCIWFNWLNRLIQPRPRTISYSTEYLTRRLTGEYSDELTVLESKIRNGDDLTLHLSTNVSKYAYQIGSNPASGDKDLLLNDWGIHHLHLKPAREKSLRRRGAIKDMLFVAVFQHDMFLIDLGTHRDSQGLC